MKDFKQQCRRLYELSFLDSKGFVDHFFESFYSKKNVVALIDKKSIVSALHLNYKKMQYFKKRVDVVLVVAAATLPELRGQKLMEKVMKVAFERLLNEKIPFASLNPFKHSYYEKFGFVTYSFCDEIDVVGGCKAVVQDADEKSLFAIYKSFCSQFDCFVVRTKNDFKRKLAEWAADGLKAKIFTFESKRCYAVSKEGCVEEFCGSLEALKQSDVNSMVEVFGDKKPNNMIRIVDVKAALECAKYQIEGKLEFEVVDSFFEANNACYQLEIENGSASVKLLEKSTGMEKILIENLTQAIFCGQPLGSFGRVFVSPILCYSLDKF